MPVTTERSCGHCGGSLQHRGARAKFCSPSCNNKAWYARNQEAQQARMAEWRRANPAKMTAATMAWKRNNRQRNREIARESHARNSETAKRSARNRRAREMGADVFSFTERDWRRALLQYRHACAWCGSTEQLQRDHVIPLARGGRHSAGNIVPACRACNAGRRDRLAVAWKRYLTAQRG